MSARVAVPKEVAPGERRVALVPTAVGKLVGRGVEVTIAAGAGAGSYFADDEYTSSGARLVDTTAQLLRDADVIVKVQPPVPG
jgi:alanine dehydrogenase